MISLIGFGNPSRTNPIDVRAAHLPSPGISRASAPFRGTPAMDRHRWVPSTAKPRYPRHFEAIEGGKKRVSDMLLIVDEKSV